MQEPSLDGLHATADPESSEHASGHKLVTAAGVAVVGGYVGYTLYQAYRADVPQSLWEGAIDGEPAEAAAVSSSPRPRVVLVNFPDAVRPWALEGLGGWLHIGREVEVVCETVMFVEEETTPSISGLGASVQRAAVYAHGEVMEAEERRGKASGKAVASPTRCCVVVYRSVTEVEGRVLEDWDVAAQSAPHWHGKSFVRRHCLGFTVDGAYATLLVTDVEGLLDKADDASSPTSSSLSSTSALVQQLGVPTTSTFRQWRPEADGYSTAPNSLMALDMLRKTEKAAPLQLYARGGNASNARAQRWHSPFGVFSLLGVVLRYTRANAAVYPELLHVAPTATVSTSAAARVLSAVWKPIQDWHARLTASLLRRYCDNDGVTTRLQRRQQLSAPFVILLRLSPGTDISSGLSEDVHTLVSEYLKRWLSSVGPSVADSSKAADVPSLHQDRRDRQSLRVDVTSRSCSVVEAAWLLVHLVNTLTATGVSVCQASLVAMPALSSTSVDAATASPLYPTDSASEAQHHGKTGSRATGWVTLRIDGVERQVFVLAQHDLAT